MQTKSHYDNIFIQKTRGSKGFTMAELLITVAIIVALMSVGFVAIINYQRSLCKLKYDGYAKEIFVAAQNHLASADNQSYLSRTDFGTKEDGSDDVYFFVVNTEGGTSVDDTTSLLELMLPVGSVDEAVRKGGCYIIRYQKSTVNVLDVFYWSESGDRFSHTYQSSDYGSFCSLKNDKDSLKKYSTDKSVIGYFGGTEVQTLSLGGTLTAPAISVQNAEKLIVNVKDSNPSADGYQLKLIVTGQTSGKSREFILSQSSYDNVTVNSTGDYTVILDDITSSGKHFSDLFGPSGLVPGEFVTIYAKSSNNTVLTNVADSIVLTANSLFGNSTEIDAYALCARIGNIRHLENLGSSISGLSNNTLFNITSAEQTDDLSWTDFCDKTGSGGTSPSIYPVIGSATANGFFMPVDPLSNLKYDGGSYSIEDIKVNSSGSNAGLFSSVTGGEIKDLMITDAVINGGNSGALAGSASGTALTNVAALSESTSNVINGSGNCGGLVGQASSVNMSFCAASVIVGSTEGNAGGLVGSASNGSSFTACYSAGHTQEAAYTNNYNVSAALTAGGLLGEASDSNMEYSYSTCSVYAPTAGGLVGTASGSFEFCYSAGKVSGTDTGAFAAVFGGNASGCYYYEIVNEISSDSGYTYLSAVNGSAHAGITAFDVDAESYSNFTGDPGEWSAA